ncbi:hypothetical protein AALO_G00094610 [Alosa alosa]|uniref:Ig-like domain-containing protein n=1 Tax=Alosa alosa TaxID=278164 RepID=A0AAV6GXD7_9TELE|nr:hypothetical protein AALO_G00094610 [Alosa alosa]
MSVNGTEGGSVVIHCPLPKPYPANTWPTPGQHPANTGPAPGQHPANTWPTPSQHLAKYLTRGHSTTLVRSSGSARCTSQGRFSICDDRKKDFFDVTIRELTVNDSGMYNCGVDTDPEPEFTQIQLFVKAASVLAMILVVTGIMCMTGFVVVLYFNVGNKHSVPRIAMNQPETHWSFPSDEISCYAEHFPVDTPVDDQSRRLSPVYQNLLHTGSSDPPEPLYQSLDAQAIKTLSVYGNIQPWAGV